jgi:hypothetical protein
MSMQAREVEVSLTPSSDHVLGTEQFSRLENWSSLRGACTKTVGWLRFAGAEVNSFSDPTGMVWFWSESE